MDASEAKWASEPNLPAERGWVEVVSPLGATMHAVVNSLPYEICVDWILLHKGRGMLCPTDPVEYFGDDLKHALPGIVAELFASAGRMDDYLSLIASDRTARAHILELPSYVFGAEVEEWELIGRCVDAARVFEARAAAQSAADEAAK